MCNIKCGQLLFEDFPVARCEACHWGFSDMVTFDSKIVTFASKVESTLNTNMPHTWLDLGAKMRFTFCGPLGFHFSPCPYGIVVVVFHFDSGGRKAKKKFLCCRNVAEKSSSSVPVLCQHLNLGKTAAKKTKKKTEHSNFDT